MRRVYVFDREAGRVVPKGTERRWSNKAEVIPDIRPFQSLIDDSIITSRRDLREHCRVHGVEQVGNELKGYKRPEPASSFDGFARELGARLSEAGLVR